MSTWIKFQYRDFYDVPRQIILQYGGCSLLLDCLFDAVRDDYAEDYEILELPDLSPGFVRETHDLRSLATKLLARVRVGEVVLDPTRRREIDVASIPLLRERR